MAFVTFSRYIPKGGGTRFASLESMMNKELAILDAEYIDPISNEVVSQNYFQKKQDIFNRYLKTATPTQANNIYVKRLQVNKDSIEYEKTIRPDLPSSISEVKAEIEDTWRNVWQTKELLNSGDVRLMALATLGEGAEGMGITNLRRELEEYRDGLIESTNDYSSINMMKDLVNFVKEQETFYRGVVNRPNNYALTVDSDKDSFTNKFELVKKSTIPSNYIDAHVNFGIKADENYPGVKLYLNSAMAEENEDGSLTIPWGGVVFKGDKDIGLNISEELSGKKTMDYPSLNLAPFGEYSAGTVLEGPDKKSIYITQQDGSMEKITEPNLINRYKDYPKRNITNIDVEKINSSYDVSDVTQQSIVERSTQSAQLAKDNYVKSLGGHQPGWEEQPTNYQDLIGRFGEYAETVGKGTAFLPKKLFGKAAEQAREIKAATPFLPEAVAETGIGMYEAGKRIVQKGIEFFKPHK